MLDFWIAFASPEELRKFIFPWYDVGKIGGKFVKRHEFFCKQQKLRKTVYLF